MNFFYKVCFGSDMDEAIPKLFFMCYKIEQMSKYFNEKMKLYKYHESKI